MPLQAAVYDVVRSMGHIPLLALGAVETGFYPKEAYDSEWLGMQLYLK